MKILLIGPGNRQGKTEHYILRALLRAGHDVSVFDNIYWHKKIGRSLNTVLRLQAYTANPDLVLFTRARHCDPDVIRKISRNRLSISWYFDAPNPIPFDYLEMVREVDALFITSMGQKSEYLKHGVKNVFFMPQACDSELHRMDSDTSNIEYPLSFVGSVGKDSHRDSFLQLVSQRMPLHVWGKNGCSNGFDFEIHDTHLRDRSLGTVIGKSYAVLGLNYYQYMNSLECYASNRIWLTLGCGGFFIGYRTPGFERVVPEGKFAEYFSSCDELFDKLYYYREHPIQRECIRKRAYEWVHCYHTYENRIRSLLEMRSYFDGKEV